jgi:dTDP-4-dehydrorhamnose reductase
MKILVTGSRGQLGKVIISHGTKNDFRMVGYPKEHLDITSKKNIKDIFSFEEPDIVINAAAFTNVEKAEKEIHKAFRINEKGLTFLSQNCSNFNIPLFHISTDYVFDGKLNRPYTEMDSVCPINVYGRSKASGEKIIRNTIKNHIILRTSWVFSLDRNSFVNKMMSLAEKKDKISVVNDQFGGPTSVDGIAVAIFKIINKYLNNKIIWGTYNFSGTPNISWYGFAKEIFKTASTLNLIKATPIIKPIRSFAYSSFARRPKNSRLNCNKIYKNFKITRDDWKIQLTEYLNTLKKNSK